MPDLIKMRVIFFDRANCASTHRSVEALHLVPALDSLKSMGFCEIRIKTSLALSPLEYDNRRLKWWQAYHKCFDLQVGVYVCEPYHRVYETL
ncbi:MAG: hypothetical protein P4L53_01055 [Candidatus Obscuribacterales bacterium]|nr:hypothetical protein [Candidatus Obscuribacterales bacterium]